jgi:endonuclease III related protein
MQFSAQAPKSDPRFLLPNYFDRMLRVFGPQRWWPARTRLEIVLGAILTQNTSWRNAEYALRGLRKEGLLRIDWLKRASKSRIETLIRPAGFFRQKAGTIRNFLAWVDENHRGSLAAMFNKPSESLRAELLHVNGFGPETVDALLLYAAKRPFFVADAYTRRVLSRHELVPEGANYNQVQEFLHNSLPRDATFFNEFHALLVEVGKRYCTLAQPACTACPLEPFLPGRARTASQTSRAGHTPSGQASIRVLPKIQSAAGKRGLARHLA